MNLTKRVDQSIVETVVVELSVQEAQEIQAYVSAPSHAVVRDVRTNNAAVYALDDARRDVLA